MPRDVPESVDTTHGSLVKRVPVGPGNLDLHAHGACRDSSRRGDHVQVALGEGPGGLCDDM